MPIASPYDHHPPLRSAAKSAFSALRLTQTERAVYERHAVYERLTQPRRFVRFAVPWMDDAGRVRVSRGFFTVGAAFSPRRCGLFFRRGLDEGHMLTLAFLTQLEDALRDADSGTALCGLDAEAAALSDGESMRLCRSAAASLMSLGLPSGMAVRLALPRRERGYFRGALDELGSACERSPGEDAAGAALCFFAQFALHRVFPLERRRVAVLGEGPCADAALRMAARLGAGVSRELSPGADVILLCGGTAPPSPAEVESILALRPAGVFEGAQLACTPQAAARLDRAGILFVPAFAVRACVMSETPAISPWEAEKRLRDSVRDMVRELLAAGGGDILRGAYAQGLSACAASLIRRGV